MRPRYLLAALGLFLVEVAIAMGYPPIPLVRHSVGDILAAALIYAFFRGVFGWGMATTAMVSLLTAATVELFQLVHAAEWLGLSPGSVGYQMLGNTFSVSDLLMYAIGVSLATWVDRSTPKGNR